MESNENKMAGVLSDLQNKLFVDRYKDRTEISRLGERLAVRNEVTGEVRFAEHLTDDERQDAQRKLEEAAPWSAPALATNRHARRRAAKLRRGQGGEARAGGHARR